MTKEDKKVYTDICGIQFEIVDRPRNSRDDNSMGKCDIIESKLFVTSEMNRDTKEATLVHEWIHAVLQHQGVEHEEILVSVLANELYREGFRVKTR